MDFEVQSLAVLLEFLPLTIIEFVCLYFPLVLGAYCTISLMKVPDLSIESAYVCGAIIGARALVMTSDMPFLIAAVISVFASMLGGVAVGLTSSLLTDKAKFPHLLSSILTSGMFHGINQFILGSSNVSIAMRRNLIGVWDIIKKYPELPILVAVTIILVIAGSLFFHTKLGTCLAVYGNNPRMFDYFGISSRFVFISGVVISNGLAGLGGFFDAQSSGFVDVNMGGLKALFCITSIILGKTIVSTKKPSSIWIPLCGSFVYFIIIHSLLKVNFNLKYFTMVNSIIVAAILILKHHQSRQRANQLGV